MHNFKIILLALVLLFSQTAMAEETLASDGTVVTLLNLKASKIILTKEIETKIKQKNLSKQEDEKERLKQEIKMLDLEIVKLKNRFETISTGIDTSFDFTDTPVKNTTIVDDLQLLVKPLIYEATKATEGMRKKSELQKESDHYKEILPKALEAYENIEELLKNPKSKKLKKELLVLKKYWEHQVTLLSSNLNASLHQIDRLEADETSLVVSLQESSKKFFQARGRFLLEGLMAMLLVVIVAHLLHSLTLKIFPSLTKANRSFLVRLLDLLYRFSVLILSIIAPMSVFYYEEDWVLFSVGLLLIFGIVWTFRHLMFKFWEQARLLLNIGSVREDERIYYQNLPWKVRNINLFTVLENPDSGVKLRLPIEELVGLTSRPSSKYEPWFPCRVNDWVILSNEYYGKVTGVSLEFIELVDMGGGHRTFLISDFLALSPLNLSTDFRVINTVGISYRHQKESTNIILDILEQFILEKIAEEGYQDGLKKLLVQFSDAGDSSLNILIIANFSGNMAPLYYRLKRAINRWAVDACTENNWEIPFPQLTIHQPEV